MASILEAQELQRQKRRQEFDYIIVVTNAEGGLNITLSHTPSEEIVCSYFSETGVTLADLNNEFDLHQTKIKGG